MTETPGAEFSSFDEGTMMWIAEATILWWIEVIYLIRKTGGNTLFFFELLVPSLIENFSLVICTDESIAGAPLQPKA